MIIKAEQDNPEFIHPLQHEVRHDDRTFDLIRLASDLVTASEQPYSEEHFNPYHELMKVMYNYVGDPDPEKRKGIHVLPDVTRDTIYGHHTYSLGCATVFNPETAELLIVRKDPDKPNEKAKDWMVISYNILSGFLTEEVVQDVVIDSLDEGDRIILDIVAQSDYQGTYRLGLSVDKNYYWDGKPATLSRKTYYGRGSNNLGNLVYIEDISILLDEITYAQQLRAEEKELAGERNPTRSVYKSVGHTAVN